LEEVRAAFIEIHAALLIDEGLQEFVFGLSDLDGTAWCDHYSPLLSVLLPLRRSGRCAFGNLTQPAQLPFLPDLAQVNQDDQPPFDFAYAGDVIELAFLKDAGRQIDLAVRDLDHFRGSVHDQTHHLASHLGHQDAILFVGSNLLLAKTLSQIYDGDDFAAQVDHSLDKPGRIGDGRDLRHTDDLVYQGDRHAEGLAPDPESDNVQFFGHPLSCRNLVVAARRRILRRRTPAIGFVPAPDDAVSAVAVPGS